MDALPGAWLLARLFNNSTNQIQLVTKQDTGVSFAIRAGSYGRGSAACSHLPPVPQKAPQPKHLGEKRSQTGMWMPVLHGIIPSRHRTDYSPVFSKSGPVVLQWPLHSASPSSLGNGLRGGFWKGLLPWASMDVLRSMQIWGTPHRCREVDTCLSHRAVKSLSTTWWCKGNSP